MYSQLYKIGDLIYRPIVENWTYSQDAGGGVIKTLQNAHYVWAKLEPLTGTFSTAFGKMNWVYGMRMICRQDALLSSASTVVWDNARWAVKSVISIDGRFNEVQLEKAETQLVSPSVLPAIANPYFFTYEATGGESSFVEASIIGKTVFGVYKDGTAKAIIVTGSPDTDEVLFDSTTGTFTFGMAFYANEKAIIQFV
jgi:hypothetical protein